jgi:hypothetical protein
MTHENPFRGSRRPLTSDHPEDSDRPGHRALALLAELDRADAFDENPAAHPLWLRAPWGLRRRYADGYIDRGEFWRALRRWLADSERRAA